MRRLISWRPTLRLALRDAAAHWLRTTLSIVLVALPITALVGWAMVEQAPVPARESALATIPADAQAVITATTIPRGTGPFPQIPEGAPAPWMGDLDTKPATAEELRAALGTSDRLIPFWRSLDLIATTGLKITPGDEASAGADVATSGLDASVLSTGRLVEADAEGLGILIPTLRDGNLPTASDEAVVSTAFAQRLGLGVGDTFALVAPPWSGWYSSDGEGRMGEVVQNVQRGYAVSGIADDTAQTVWAPEGWMSKLISADPAGVDGRWLVVGDDPVTWDQAKALNELQAFVVSRDVLENPPPPSALYPVAVDADALILRVVVTTITTLLGALLVLGLVTPAFAVAADEARRMLGLAAVAGATPRDLRRTILAQGGMIGLAGGMLGIAFGLIGGMLLAALAYPAGDVWARFPWWAPVTGIVTAVGVGLVATLGPARRTARLRPVDAVRDRITPSAVHSRRRWRAVVGAALPLVFLIAATAAGYHAFALAEASPSNASRAPGSSAPLSGFLVAVAVILFGTALLLGIRVILGGIVHGAPRAPIALRLALRDAHDHSARVVPAAAGVLVAVLAASAFVVIAGSGTQNSRDTTGQMVADGRFVLGVSVPVSPDFDRLVLADTVRALQTELPIIGTAEIRTTALNGDAHLSALTAADKSCPTGLVPDVASALDPARTTTCTDPDNGFRPMLSVAWMGGTDVFVLDPAAVRASGLPGADAAASVLANGGVIVNDATKLSRDNTVVVATGSELLPTAADATSTTTLPGAFLRGFAPSLTVSPATAHALGVAEFDYLGEYVLTDRPLTTAELNRARELVTAHTSLVNVATPQFVEPWGGDGTLIAVLGLASLAVAATIVSLLLARTQARRDATTMYAVGAAPRFLRRLAAAQGSLILILGVPLGMLAGVACGTYLIAWFRFAHIDRGVWLETVPLWDLQLALAGTIVAASLAGVLLVARPPRRAVRRLD
ncbi:FtsX-like permease family protein [Microbacterium sp.]|uniref:FtsX-like permease family protein n=1 Tax=Microbacterium sp. TaxID=51671 RepID=UPI0039E26C8C